MKQVYVVTDSWTYDSGECSHTVVACANEEEARRIFKDMVKDARCDMADASNTVEEYDEQNMSFSIYVKGYYSSDHIDVSVTKCDVVDHEETVFVFEGLEDNGVGVSYCDRLDDGKWSYDSYKRRFYGKTNKELEDFMANNTSEGDTISTEWQAVAQCKGYWLHRSAKEREVHQDKDLNFEALDIKEGERVIVKIHY